ncbi:STAS domain-containing protein [Sinosporangium siamense]|uniref:STAS domain-containing protein n=1 Tax=Sinosporangium siamense TaxID=1367973 RepID=A0A919RLG9_9ACTN|nr:STAS domain-containing protein [Sinosporangium siamense]GII94301.1 hypothetical protein Ssi02_45320 [Sinosporangium siamense]
MSALSVQAVYYNRFCLLVLSGELDVLSAPQVRRALTEVLSRRNRIVVDAARLTFCDCTGIRVLAGGHRRAVAAGGGLSLAFAHGLLQRLLEIDRCIGAGPGGELVTTLRW